MVALLVLLNLTRCYAEYENPDDKRIDALLAQILLPTAAQIPTTCEALQETRKKRVFRMPSICNELRLQALYG